VILGKKVIDITKITCYHSKCGMGVSRKIVRKLSYINF